MLKNIVRRINLGLIMAKLPILLILASPLFIVSCVDGGEIARDALREVERFLDENQYTSALLESDRSIDSNNDGRLSVDEIDCSAPGFTQREPLPPGETHLGIAVSGSSYWECSESEERYLADGTFSGRFTSDYQGILDFWNICRVGTRPPNVSGVWNARVLEGENVLCLRPDIMPGLVFCTAFYLSQDGFAATTYGNIALIHGGEVFIVENDEEDTCIFREE